MIMPYKTVKVGVLSIRNEFDTTPSSSTSICKEDMINTAKIDVDFEEIEPTKQEIGSLSGFHANIQSPVSKSKPYYYLTLPKPPGKSVVNEVMMRMLDVIMEKNNFIQLVGHLPVYKLIVQLKNKNPLIFPKFLPILGPFHCQCSFINVINKIFAGSVLSDIIVSADVIAEKSVDQAFRATHFNRITIAINI